MIINTDDICGTSEVAELLGVLKQRIHALRKMSNFPKPVIKLASTPIWDKKEIMSFKNVWKNSKKSTTTQ